MGDLAETPGKNVNNDCKVWEFTVKDGVKFEDGRPITSKEIAYGIARSFDPDLSGGPTTSRSGWPTPRSSTPSGTSRRTRRRCRRV
ncbi:ABC transporter substrate-binding protein [Micromonospora sp. M12]